MRDKNDLIFLKQKKPCVNEQTGKIQTKCCKLLTVFQRLVLSARVQERKSKCDPGLSQELASYRFPRVCYKSGSFFLSNESSQVP